MSKRVLSVVLVAITMIVAVWAVVHFVSVKNNRQRESAAQASAVVKNTTALTWDEAVEKVKAERIDPSEVSSALVIPSELKHYSDRHWFLATQVAEVTKYNVQNCQDYVDLAAMIQRGQLVAVPAVTDTYVLFGVGAKADDRVFTKYQDDHEVQLYSNTQLADVYKQLDTKRSGLQSEITSLNVQLSRLKKNERAKQRELQKQITARQQEVASTDEDKAVIDQTYGQLENRQKLLQDYESLKALAKDFGGRSYNLDDPLDRQALKIQLLSAIRPEALKILEEVASAYQRQFNRPLPVSSLVRPEQYQHVLRRVNRNAVLIDTPPHSTGLAFDIDYRYMSAGEQTFVMNELARIKNAGRIEVIRERNSNYHVFAFVNGVRPSDELITASLDKASTDEQEAHHPAGDPAQEKHKPRKEKSRPAKSKVRKHR